MADETDALSAAERLKFEALGEQLHPPAHPLESDSLWQNAEEWTFDKLAMASALYQAAKDEEAEEKLGRVLKAVAAKIVQQVREAVKTGGTRVGGILEFKNFNAIPFRDINMQSTSTHPMPSDSKEFHNGILMRLESLLPAGLRSTDHARFNEAQGLRVWFFFERPETGKSSRMEYQFDWSATFKNALKTVKEKIAPKKRAHEDANQEAEKRAKTDQEHDTGCVRQDDEWSTNAELQLAQLVYNDQALLGEFDWTKIATEFNEWAKSVGEPERDRDALRSYAESRAAALAEDEDEDEEEEAEAKDAAMAETTPTADGGCVRQHDEWSKYAELKLEELVWYHPAPVGEFDWTKIATEFNEWAERVGEPERDRDALRAYVEAEARRQREAEAKDAAMAETAPTANEGPP